MEDPRDRIIAAMRAVSREKDREMAAKDRRIAELEAEKKMAYIDRIIATAAYLYTYTGMTPGEFEFACLRFLAAVGAARDRPLFSDPGFDEGDPGNRCKCSIRHVMFLTLANRRVGHTQASLAALGLVSQGTVSKYVRFATPLLARIMPGGRRMSAEIASAETFGDLRKIIPGGRVTVDGTYARVQRPGEDQRMYYSGKRRTHAYVVTVIANKNHLILHAGRAFPGSTHDMTMVRQDMPGWGRWAEAMADPDTPEAERLTVVADLGYMGLDKVLPGARVVLPRKRPPGGSLTMGQMKWNEMMGRVRITVENAICRLKQNRKISELYRGTIDDFDEDMDLISGMVNFHILWRMAGGRRLLGRLMPLPG